MPGGRPRTFDLDKALDRALQVFWRKGYEGAALPELTAAMGINRPSLYAAFGNKETLFRRAVDRYMARHGRHVTAALDLPTAREAVAALWRGNIELVANARNPRGCLLVHGALACGESGETTRREMIKRRGLLELALRKRFDRAIREGDLPAGSNAADLAKYVATVSHGMAVQAASGASAGELRRVADMALRAWPR